MRLPRRSQEHFSARRLMFTKNERMWTTNWFPRRGGCFIRQKLCAKCLLCLMAVHAGPGSWHFEKGASYVPIAKWLQVSFLQLRNTLIEFGSRFGYTRVPRSRCDFKIPSSLTHEKKKVYACLILIQLMHTYNCEFFMQLDILIIMLQTDRHVPELLTSMMLKVSVRSTL